MTKRKVSALNHCRLCGSKDLKTVINLGFSPPPNTLLKKSQLKKKEESFPLKVNFCTNCWQVQLSHVVSPKLMFQNYPYVSSTSSVMVDHFNRYASVVFKKLNLKKNDFAVEIGSNDGILLKYFGKLGLNILGVDPARNIAKIATKNQVPTLPYFFDSKIAKKIAKAHGKAKLILANNVFAHIDDLNDVMKGVNELMDENGAFIIEFPYLIDVIDNNVFDSIYHEHLSYLAVNPLNRFFNRFGMEIFNIDKSDVQGGSIRIYVKRFDAKYPISKSVSQYLKLEKRRKINKIKTYLRFSTKIRNTKRKLDDLLSGLRKKDKKLIGYGAPGRSTTLLNYCGIDTKTLDLIVDDNPNKHGLYTPGVHIPVFSTNQIKTVKPDYIVILSWNFADSIMKRLKDYSSKGGRFIIPIPTPKIV